MRFLDLFGQAGDGVSRRTASSAKKSNELRQFSGLLGRVEQAWRRWRRKRDALARRVEAANRTLGLSAGDDSGPSAAGNSQPPAMEAESLTQSTKQRHGAAAPKAPPPPDQALSQPASPQGARPSQPRMARSSPPPLPSPALRSDTPRRARRAPHPNPGPSPLNSLLTEVEDVIVHAMERPSRGWKKNSGRAVILIHGAGVDHRDWTFGFIDRVAPSWRVLAFDRPGFGASTRRPGAASALPATQARLLRKAAESLGVEEAIVVGHSWGGAVAMAWGVGAPEQTLGVASLAGAVAPWSLGRAIENGRRLQSAARTALGEGGMRAAAIEAMEESFSPAPIPSGYVEHMATELTPMKGPAAATMADVSTINGALALMTPSYPEFGRPVELVYGDSDVILSPIEQGETAAALLPNARLTVLKGAGHMLHHSHPARCMSAVERLIAAAQPVRKVKKRSA